MTFAQLALCFASAVLGAVVGVKLLFLLAKPHAKITLDLKLKTDPVCPDCGRTYGPRELLENVATDTFDVTMKDKEIK